MTLDQLFDFFARLFRLKLFELGGTQVTIMSIVMLTLVFATFQLIAWTLCRAVLERALTRLQIDRGTRYTILRITHYLVLLVGAFVAFQFVGVDLSGLVVVFGFLSVGIGFGLQNITSNFISGLILLIERPIRVGDRVTVGATEGDVVEINMRSTTICSVNNIAIIVPNSDFISSSVINWSYRDPKIRLDIDVGVSYDSDLDLVLRSMMDVARESKDVLKTPPPAVLHRGFGDSAWNMRLQAWIGDPVRHNEIRSDIHCAIVRKFRQNGIEIPYPQRDVRFRTPLPPAS